MNTINGNTPNYNLNIDFTQTGSKELIQLENTGSNRYRTSAALRQELAQANNEFSEAQRNVRNALSNLDRAERDLESAQRNLDTITRSSANDPARMEAARLGVSQAEQALENARTAYETASATYQREVQEAEAAILQDRAIENSLTFDAEYYLSNNPDVLAAVQQGAIASAYDHFMQFGIN